MSIYKKFTWSNLFNFSILSIFTMYIEIIKGIETQPFFIFLISFLYIIHSIKICLKKNLLILIIAIFFIFFEVLISKLYLGSNIFEALKYIVGPIIFFAFLNNNFYLTLKYLNYIKYIIRIIFIYYLIMLFKIPFLFSFFLNIQSILIPRFELYSGIRGFGFFTPEPSYMVLTLIFFYILIDVYDFSKKYFDKLLIIIVIILLKSATGYLLMFFYLFIRLFKFSLKSIILTSIFFMILSFSLSLFPNRLLEIYNRIDVSNIDVYNLLFFLDPSFGSRIALNTIALLAPLIYYFGAGFGTLNFTWIYISHFFNINFLNNIVLKNLFLANQSIHAHAYIPNLVYAMGIFAIPIVYLILKPITFIRKESKKYKAVYIVTLYMFFIQSQITNPIPWILLSIIYLSNKKGNYENN